MKGVPALLIAAGLVQVVCQLFKLVYYSIRDGRLEWKYLTTAGGIPSAHSAFVTSLTVLIGMKEGINSDVFAITFAFAAIVIFDAYRLRGHVQNLSIRFNRLLDRLGVHEDTKITEMIGHSVVEIATGMLIGGLLAVAASPLVV